MLLAPLIIAALKFAAIASAVGLAVLVVAAITMAVIETFFDEWKETNEIDPDDVGFMVNEAINEGSAKVIAGVFNKRSGKVREGAKRIEGREIDRELTRDKVTIFS